MTNKCGGLWLMLFSIIAQLLLATSAVAQEQSVPQPYVHMANGLGLLETPDQRRAREAKQEADRLAACRRMLEEENAVPLGYWGHRHLEAHCKEWIAQLHQSTGSSCCSSPFDGECRVTRYYADTQQVEIDGMLCPAGHAARGAIIGLELGLVLACASRSTVDASGFRRCPTVHCIGGSPGL